MKTYDNNPNQPLRRLTILSIVAITISFLVLLGSLLWWIWFAKSDIYSPKEIVMDLSVKTTDGIRQELVLGDNSIVWVNANSVLKYAADYKVDRQLNLSGEAYFKIKKNDKPFTLITEHATVYLFGGVFLVEAYENKSYLRFTLFDGEGYLVSKASGQKTTLNPGIAITMVNDSGQMEINRIEKGVYGPSWLVSRFEYMAFNSVLYALSDFYDVSVTNNRPELNYEPYSLTFEGNKSLDEVMKILQAISKNFQYRILDKEMVIY
ncbi:MAG: FecR family protein [Bacteroides sp.]|nr:FecR family protein [Bacteroides sp.]